MSAPTSSHDKISISFTGLLYGVVIDAALHRFEEFRLTPANLLLLIALVIVIQDFFFYHLDLKEIGGDLESREETAPSEDEKKRVRKRKGLIERIFFVFDILVLGTWFILALSAHEGSVLTYLYYLSTFFAFVYAWEFVKQRLYRKTPLRYTHLPVTVVSAAVTIAAYYILRPASAHPAAASRVLSDWSWVEWVLLCAPLAFFLAWRFFYWFGNARKRLRDEDEPGTEIKGVGARIPES